MSNKFSTPRRGGAQGIANQDVDAGFRRIEGSINKVGAIAYGEQIDNIDLSSSPVTVQHTLGRAYKGWFVVDIDGSVDVFANPSEQRDKSRFIVLRGGAATASIWIY